MQVSEQYINSLKNIINTLTIDLENVMYMTVPQRIICKLIKLCNGKAAYRLPVSKGILAMRIGVQAETLSRAVQRLKNHGVRITGRNVEFADVPHMVKTVCDACAGRKSCPAVKELVGE